MKTDLRQMALDSVLEYEKTGQKLDAVVHEKLNRHPDLQPAQKRFYVRLTFGTVEKMIRLDHIIEACSDTPLKKIRPVVLWILRLGVYQIEEMDGTPRSAVVNEAVKMAEKRGYARLKGYVNAVLRNIIRSPGKVCWPKEDEPVKYISVVFSVPVYLAEKTVRDLGFEKAKSVFESFGKERPLAVHIKKTGNDPQKTVESLKSDGAQIEALPWPNSACFLSVAGDLRELTAFREGKFFVQDISSQLAVFAAGIRPDDRVLDVCAAPGGKSLLAADLLDGTGLVVARDVSENRVKTLKENIARMGFLNITAEVKDALSDDEYDHGKYDVVLVDAPCSGYGVIGRKPDIKYTASAEKEEELSALQKKILHNAAACVKPGGTLIYSTCTVSPSENEQNAEWFLKTHDFNALQLSQRLPEELCCHGNTLQLLPCARHDGFFIAAFRKAAQTALHSVPGEA